MQWVKASERLPEKSGMYITLMEVVDKEDKQIYKPAGYNHFDCILKSFPKSRICMEAATVTHWLEEHPQPSTQERSFDQIKKEAIEEAKRDMPVKDAIAQILRDNIYFSGQLGDYVIHGAIEKIIEYFKPQERSFSLKDGLISVDSLQRLIANMEEKRFREEIIVEEIKKWLSDPELLHKIFPTISTQPIETKAGANSATNTTHED